jgi:hypothetical protein
MASKTFLGRDIFSAYWGAVLLGFLSQHRPLVFPASQELKNFVKTREESINRFLTSLQSISGLPDDAVQIARVEAPWATTVDLDSVTACSDVALLAGRWIETDELASTDLLRDTALVAVGKLLDGLAASIYSFGDRDKSLAQSCLQIVDALSEVIGDDNPIAHAVRRGYQHWLQHRLPSTISDPNTVPAYREWLKRKLLES